MAVKKQKVRWIAKGDYDDRDALQDFFDGLQYSLVTADDADGVPTQCFPFIHCREYLNDAIWYGVNKVTEFTTFGVTVHNYRAPASTATRVLLANNLDEKKFPARCRAAVKFVNYFERKMGLLPTELRECVDPPKKLHRVFLAEGSRMWQLAPPMISLYSLLLRVGMVHDPKTAPPKTIQKVKAGEIKPYQAADARQLVHAEKGIEWVMGEPGFRKLFGRNRKPNYPKHVPTDDIHSECGIVGLAHRYCEDNMPNWFTHLPVAARY